MAGGRLPGQKRRTFFPPEYFSVFLSLEPGNPFPVLVTVPPVTRPVLLCPGVSTTMENVLLLQYAVSCYVVAYLEQTRFPS